MLNVFYAERVSVVGEREKLTKTGSFGKLLIKIRKKNRNSLLIESRNILKGAEANLAHFWNLR